MAERSPDAPEAADARADPSRSRLAELARGAPAALLLFGADGALLAQNDTAREAFGAAAFADLLGSAERAAERIAEVRARGQVRVEAELRTRGEPAWFLMQLKATSDPETGAFAVSLSAEDLTERRVAERAKDEFISIVNHELRTPLTAIRGAVGLLANDVVGDVSQRGELFDIAWDNVQRLGRLVDDLLDVQRLRIGAVDLVITRIEIAALVTDTLDLLAPRATEKGIDLRVLDSTPDAHVLGDPGRIMQALSNLVTNAMKHAPSGTAVSVSVADRGTHIRVSVHDEGPGVPDAFVAKLFSPFSQADCTDARAGSGAGLGLYIVRTLIEAHDGRVGYTPSAGRGACFYFELPAAPADAAPAGSSATRP